MTDGSGAMSMAGWTRESATEPMVRVGVILDVDAHEEVRLTVPNGGWRIGTIGSVGTALNVGASIAVRLVGDALDAGEHGKAGALRIWREMPEELAPGVGVLVRDVVAGRGFHWQKNIDQTLPGEIELSAGRQGVVLVNVLPLEAYLAGVITSEMGAACPADLLKAQCVVARSWLLAMSEPKHTDDPFDRCNDDCCQRYQGTGGLSAAALDAARATRGRALITPDGTVLDANYSKSCGGISELPTVVWNTEKAGVSAVVDAPEGADTARFFPMDDERLDEYLDGDWLKTTDIYCSPNVVPEDTFGEYLGRVDESGSYFRWTVTYGRRELEELLISRMPEAYNMAALHDLRVVSRGVSGRVSELDVEWEDDQGQRCQTRLGSEYRIREALHRKFLYSSAFALRIARDDHGKLESVTLRGAGWGHGVGMCQIGALGMALKGNGYERICTHYFPEAQLVEVYA